MNAEGVMSKTDLHPCMFAYIVLSNQNCDSKVSAKLLASLLVACARELTAATACSEV